MKEPSLRWTCVCILAMATPSFCQVATTSLKGTVRDPSGALVPRAEIIIADEYTGKSTATVTDNTGQYAFFQISPSKYEITVRAPGFGQQTKSAELLVNQPATINFSLTVEDRLDTIDVSATAQTLNTSDASLGTSAGSELIQALPSDTRNVPDFLSLQPGVLSLPTGDSRNGAVNGGRSDQGNVTIDGVDDNDQVNGFAFFGVLRETQDSIEEFRAVTSNANSEAGRSSGAQISLVTKSGTNRFHGAAYEYYRSPIGAANEWFNKQTQLNGNLPNVPMKVLRNTFGIAASGPVKKGKLFFFGNFEAVRQADDAQIIHTVATQAHAAGSIVYPDASGNVHALSPGDVVALDAGCQICNTTGYPNGPGPNPNALAYFNSMPIANGTLTGDGYNQGSYSFASPNPVDSNTSIVRFDYVPSDQHRIFARGQLQKDTVLAPEQFLGQGPSSTYKGNNKGIIAGETWTILPSLSNDLRYGYIRQGFGVTGVGKGEYVDFLSMSTPTAQSRSGFQTVPVNNIIDNLSWTKGKHTIQTGGNWRLIHQNYASDANSWNGATTSAYWLAGNPPDPSSIAASPVGPGFQNSYEIAFANLVGTVPQIFENFNYQITSPTSGSTLAEGAFIQRHFKANEFEWYVQDAWRMKPNITITLGVRHSILQTPYETKGQEVTPTIDTHAWYLQRESAAQQGQIYEPELSFAPDGAFYGKPGFWPDSKDNFAPRLAIVYAPNPTTSIRAGVGIYYDHFGEALVNMFDHGGSFGMSSSLLNPTGVYSIEGNDGYLPSPRFTSRTVLPQISVGSVPTSQTFPYTPPANFAITWGLDNRMQTPYSEVFDLSVQRELPGGFTIEGAYVGRMGRHLLQQVDLAEPVDYVDPRGGGDYFAAGTQLSRDVDQNKGDSMATVQAIPYFENVFPFMASFDYPGESATQAIYTNGWAPFRTQLGATMALADLDFYCSYGCSSGWVSHFWQDQVSSLYALSSVGTSSYNAGQLTLRRPMNHGLYIDFSYTFSKSIDWGSDAERNTEFSGAFSEILNTWKPYLNRSVSDFDTTHLITAVWVYSLPFGKANTLAGNANALLNAFIGGWQWSGISRWSSALPFGVFDPGWSTNWQISSFGVVTGEVKVRKHLDSNGNPQFFDNVAAINKGIATGSPMRLSYPGEAGQRNKFRGDGYSNVNSGLAKTWKIGEYGRLKFNWEVYNVANTVRFDPASISNQLTGGNLGVATALLTVPRRMQFGLRYDF